MLALSNQRRQKSPPERFEQRLDNQIVEATGCQVGRGNPDAVLLS
jgi:hypothetical protein